MARCEVKTKHVAHRNRDDHGLFDCVGSLALQTRLLPQA